MRKRAGSPDSAVVSSRRREGDGGMMEDEGEERRRPPRPSSVPLVTRKGEEEEDGPVEAVQVGSERPQTSVRNKTGMKLRVVVRVRPLLGRELSSKDNQPCVSALSDTQLGVSHSSTKDKGFRFDRVLGPDAGQEETYRYSGIEMLLQSSLNGYSSAVLCYGQTGSGKTYTMNGLEELILRSGGYKNPESDGMLPRCCQYLFQRIEELSGSDYQVVVRASYLEIYNERVIDLLHPSARNLAVRQSLSNENGVSAGAFFVENLTVVECHNLEDLVVVAAEGHKNRHVASHELNQDSSRSHSLMTVYLEIKQNGIKKHGKVSFVDLAGSENLKSSKSQGSTLKETASINKSLFVLGTVISALADMNEKKKSRSIYVPYRDSVLTKLLSESLGGSGLTMIIACCSPAVMHLDETLRTLHYAARARNIKSTPLQNVSAKDMIIETLRAEVQALKKEIEQLKAGQPSLESSVSKSVLRKSSVTFSPSTLSHPKEAEEKKNGFLPRIARKSVVSLGTDEDESTRTLELKNQLSPSSVSSRRFNFDQSSPTFGSPSHNDSTAILLENERLKQRLHKLEQIFLTQDSFSFSKLNRDDLEGTMNEESRLREENARLKSLNVDLLKRIQRAEFTPDDDAPRVPESPNSNLKSGIQDTLHLMRANQQLERQIEAFRLREQELQAATRRHHF